MNLKNILTATTTLYYLKEKTTYTFELRLIIKNTRIPSVNYIYKQIPEQYKVYKHKHFIYSLLNNITSDTNGEDNLKSLNIVFASYKSNTLNKEIDLKL